MLSRRKLLSLLAAFPFTGWLIGKAGNETKKNDRIDMISQRDFFKELGVRRFINGQGTITTLSGSLMPPEVLDAIQFASRDFVKLIELNEKVGNRIAEMLNCEDAHVTAGAASAIQLAVAASITGNDREKVRRIPNIPGPNKEVVMPKNHRIYEQQFTACGVKIVEADGPEELEKSINENTVIGFYFNASPHQSISREEFVEICRSKNIPSFNDAAADVPPVENLFKYIEMGFDLVTFSGCKAIRGPQSAGLLFGKKELIEAARLNHSPYGSIGRGMKVNKEEVIAMMVALERYLENDHEKEWKMWEQWVEKIAEKMQTIPSVQTEMFVPEVANHVPHLRITWDPQKIEITSAEVQETLSKGEPAIEIFSRDEALELNVFMMKPGEPEIVGNQIEKILEKAIRS